MHEQAAPAARTCKHRCKLRNLLPNYRAQVAGETGECDTDGRCYLGPSWFSVIKEIRNQMDISFVSNSGAACCGKG